MEFITDSFETVTPGLLEQIKKLDGVESAEVVQIEDGSRKGETVIRWSTDLSLADEIAVLYWEKIRPLLSPRETV